MRSERGRIALLNLRCSLRYTLGELRNETRVESQLSSRALDNGAAAKSGPYLGCFKCIPCVATVDLPTADPHDNHLLFLRFNLFGGR